MRRKKAERPCAEMPDRFDRGAVMIAAASPELLIERLNHWCDSETGILPKAARRFSYSTKHSMAIHVAPINGGKDWIFVAVLTPQTEAK